MSSSTIGEDFTPNPFNLLLSNRNIGYTLEEAIADLIDNSITAGSKNIWLNFDWNDGSPHFSITDDGHGMDTSIGELAMSFRLATKNPLNKREKNDLGRYGSGMKTASLSQAKSFVVISKVENGDIGIRSLDIDFIAENDNKWILKIPEEGNYQTYVSKINERGHGTTLLWENWDRHPFEYADFITAQTKVINYISVCFHRFLSKNSERLTENINIYHQSEDNPLTAINPIPQEVTSPRSECLLQSGEISERAYLIPHPSTWESNYNESLLFNSYSLFNGYERQQGIYIYRCNRLLNPYGGWLGLAKANNGTKLARVTIDFPNSADEKWQLDITKTKAQIPFDIKNDILRFIETSQIQSRQKITHGNRSIRESISKANSSVWIQKKHENLYITYEINKNYLGFNNFFKNKKNIDQNQFNQIIQLISSNIPIQEIIDNHEENSNLHDINNQNLLTQFQLELALTIYTEFRRGGNSHKQALHLLKTIEPFCYDQINVEEFINSSQS